MMLPKIKYRNQLSYSEDNDIIINRLINIMNHSKLSSGDVCRKAGIGPNAIAGWKAKFGTAKRNPSLKNIQSVLNVLGFKLVVRRKGAPDISNQ
jgi:DNA-binding phage protein